MYILILGWSQGRHGSVTHVFAPNHCPLTQVDLRLLPGHSRRPCSQLETSFCAVSYDEPTDFGFALLRVGTVRRKKQETASRYFQKKMREYHVGILQTQLLPLPATPPPPFPLFQHRVSRQRVPPINTNSPKLPTRGKVNRDCIGFAFLRFLTLCSSIWLVSVVTFSL